MLPHSWMENSKFPKTVVIIDGHRMRDQRKIKDFKGRIGGEAKVLNLRMFQGFFKASIKENPAQVSHTKQELGMGRLSSRKRSAAPSRASVKASRTMLPSADTPGLHTNRYKPMLWTQTACSLTLGRTYFWNSFAVDTKWCLGRLHLLWSIPS